MGGGGSLGIHLNWENGQVLLGSNQTRAEECHEVGQCEEVFSLSLNVHTFLLWQASCFVSKLVNCLKPNWGIVCFWFHSDEEEALGE